MTTAIGHDLAHATDDQLRAAIEQAELPSLMPALGYLTGDLSLVASELRPPASGSSVVPAAQGGMTQAQQELARRRALEALIAFRDGGCVPAAPPTRLEDRRALMTFMTSDVDDRYLPMLAFELGLPADSDAPGWTKEAVAPGRDFRVAIIGAGMSGLAAAYRLLQAGVDFVVFERNDDVGGVWLENDYPGCRLDTSNFSYSYSFLQRDDWPHQYSRGPEVRAYFQDAGQRLGLLEHIRFGTPVRAARFDERAGDWLVTVDADGHSETVRFNAVISATGQLNQPNVPDIPGAADFGGVGFHSARWDHGADLRGKRVGVVGSGASGYQVIPSIAGEVAEMRVFMRNPPWTVPTPKYHAAVNPGLAWLFRVVPHYHRWFRFYQFWTSVEGRRDFAAADPHWREPGSVSAKNHQLRETLTRHLMAEYEGRPDLQRVMIPRYPPYGKRMLRDNGVWARALKQPNVTVVGDRIERISPAGIVTADGTEHQLDVIVYCTGFQAWRFLGGIDVTGSGGVDLHQRWGQDPAAYLGITIPDFPNLFCLYGPNTNLIVNGSIVMFSECAVHYVLECLRMLLERGDQVMDLRPAVLDAYQATVDEANALMAWGAEGVDNWYKSPTGRVSQNWPLTTIEYWDLTRAPDPGHYRFEGRLTVQDWDVFFLGGRWQPAASADRVEVVSPASLKVVGSVPRATKEDGDRAVSAARAAFDAGRWPRLPVAERLGVLQAFADAIEARTDQFADVLCAEQGLPRRGLPGQIAMAVSTLRVGADIAGDYPWTGTRRGTGRRTLRVLRVPVGVVVAIVPWNAPLFVAAMKLAPALAAGNTVVLKPPPETPLHTYLLAEAALEAGLPDGVLNILPAGADISELLVRDPRVDKVSFTGSTAVGREVGAICGASLKRCTLELGGKSAAVVLDDFELTDASARMLVAGAMVNAGQVCAAQTRILVPAARHQEIVEAMSAATRALRVGDPESATTDIGPLISGRQRDRVERYIRLGVEEGASLVTGGGRPAIEPGWYVQPTLFAGVDNAMTIAREEIFGPVAAVIPCHDEAEAVALANDSEYGLAGAVWTADLGRGEAVAARIRTGTVAVNSPGALDACGPFGGFKNSGFGREGGTEALDDYTECQTIILPGQATRREGGSQ